MTWPRRLTRGRLGDPSRTRLVDAIVSGIHQRRGGAPHGEAVRARITHTYKVQGFGSGCPDSGFISAACDREQESTGLEQDAKQRLEQFFQRHHCQRQRRDWRERCCSE